MQLEKIQIFDLFCYIFVFLRKIVNIINSLEDEEACLIFVADACKIILLFNIKYNSRE